MLDCYTVTVVTAYNIIPVSLSELVCVDRLLAPLAEVGLSNFVSLPSPSSSPLRLPLWGSPCSLAPAACGSASGGGRVREGYKKQGGIDKIQTLKLAIENCSYMLLFPRVLIVLITPVCILRLEYSVHY